MSRAEGDNSKELAVQKLFQLAEFSVRAGCLAVFEDEVWTAFMRKKVPLSKVREHIRSRFCIPSGELHDLMIEEIILAVPLR